MRIRGFLLVEAMIFVLVMSLSCVVMCKVMFNYTNMVNDSMFQLHQHALTNTHNIGNEYAFDTYCKNNNIIIKDRSKYNCRLLIKNKEYVYSMNDSQDGYDLIAV